MIIALCRSGRETTIPAHAIRVQADTPFRFFVPFDQEGSLLPIDWEADVLSRAYERGYEYGFLVYSGPTRDGYAARQILLNAGIRISGADLGHVLGVSDNGPNRYSGQDRGHNYYVANVPPSWLRIDVSRDNVSGLSPTIQAKMDAGLRAALAGALCGQAAAYQTYAGSHQVDTPLSEFQELLQFIDSLCGDGSPETALRVSALEFSIQIAVGEDRLTITLAQGPLPHAEARRRPNNCFSMLHRTAIPPIDRDSLPDMANQVIQAYDAKSDELYLLRHRSNFAWASLSLLVLRDWDTFFGPNMHRKRDRIELIAHQILRLVSLSDCAQGAYTVSIPYRDILAYLQKPAPPRFDRSGPQGVE